ncbi:MAG: carbohydrate ABC transporter permease [Fimbriimonas sp.]|nr:carbohydrate ABC transporter permease [Fimbriimonas sp.]
MSSNLLVAIGTLSAWIGAVCLLRGLYLGLSHRPGFGWPAGVGGSLFLLAASLPTFEGRLEVPLIWVVLPFTGWMAVMFGLLAAAYTGKAVLDSNPKLLLRAGVSLAAAILLVALYRADPENRFVLLRGSIRLSAEGALAIVGFAAAAVAVMASAGRRARERGRLWATHATLLAGCVVFGMPFAWLMVTSFKEDRDMASPNGIVWIPRVQRTVPYMDRKDPLLEGEFEGNWVQATLAGKDATGNYIVEVQRPYSLRGVSFTGRPSSFRVVEKDAPMVSGVGFTGFVVRELSDGRRVVQFLSPPADKGSQRTYLASELEPIRDIGLRTQNYTEAMEAMPPETRHGLVYLKNTLILVVMGVFGTLLSSSLVAYGFARLRFPGRDLIFKILLATMMLPGAVTLLPQFLLFRSLGWIDSLLPLWVPAFFASAFNVFLIRQFFVQIPTELEDAGKIDGASVLGIFWRIMLPQIKPALAVVAIWTFMGAWNNFMGPLIYVNSPENMPLSYALQLFQTEKGGNPGLMMAFATLTVLPVIALFMFTQKYFIEGVTLSGLGGR